MRIQASLTFNKWQMFMTFYWVQANYSLMVFFLTTMLALL